MTIEIVYRDLRAPDGKLARKQVSDVNGFHAFDGNVFFRYRENHVVRIRFTKVLYVYVVGE